MSSSSSLLSTENASPWLYFIAGSVVSTLSWWVLNSYRNTAGINDTDSGYDSDSETDVPNRQTPNLSKYWDYQDAPYKMVLVVNTSLSSMGKGKMAAQCCHAAVGCYKKAAKTCPNALHAWERTGCAKIAVKCPTEEEMLQIMENAMQKDIPLYLVEDAGRTQIAAGSRTVLGSGPAPVSVFDGVTSHLKLM